jgi:hypothetical protein
MMAPPQTPPGVALGDDGNLHRLHVRLWLVLLTALTTCITAWFCTLGPIPAIVAIMVAKHILVAILVMGLGVDKPKGAV